MFSPSKRTMMSPRNAVPLKGLFQDGIWMCNCRERLPAVKRETKKAGKNQGRYCKYSKSDALLLVGDLY